MTLNGKSSHALDHINIRALISFYFLFTVQLSPVPTDFNQLQPPMLASQSEDLQESRIGLERTMSTHALMLQHTVPSTRYSYVARIVVAA